MKKILLLGGHGFIGTNILDGISKTIEWEMSRLPSEKYMCKNNQ